MLLAGRVEGCKRCRAEVKIRGRGGAGIAAGMGCATAHWQQCVRVDLSIGKGVISSGNARF